jgi:molybdopterin synthase catalytic subunit
LSRLVRGEIDLVALCDSVSAPERGGTASFVGTVRSGPDDGPVGSIEYTAYEEMADAELERIVAEVASGWPEVRLAVSHRLGIVPVGEASVAVVAAAPHRADAFDACRHAIEEIKQRVPIWKKELLEDGKERWRENEAGRKGPWHSRSP